MKNRLLKLSSILSRLHLKSYANEVDSLASEYDEPNEPDEPDEYDEPWHEEAVKEFPEKYESEEELLKNVTIPPESMKDEELTALHQHGITPVTRGDNSGFLGVGKYATVYSAVYEGKPVSAKIGFYGKQLEWGEAQDVEVWRAIQQASQNIAPELQKHIPNIYGTFTGSVESKKYNTTIRYYIILMEELDPVPSSIKKAFSFGELKGNLTDMVNLIYHPEEFKRQIQKILIDSKDEQLISLSKQIVVPTRREVLKRLTDAKNTFEMTYSLLRSFLKNYLSYSGIYQGNIPDKIYREIIIYIDDNFDLYDLYSSPFPIHYNEPEDNPSSEFQSFLDFLRILEDYGIKWKDVHEENIMIGKKDREIKLVDVGVFKI